MLDGLAKPILTATLVAGTLDICAAFIQAAVTRGTAPSSVLQFVASGVLDKAAYSGGAGSAAFGLALHFAIMAVMVTVFVLAATRLPMLTAQPWLWGPIYGLGLWCVMNLIVLPLRWPALYPPTNLASIALQLVFHLFLVGLPIALITARALRA